MGKEPCKVCGEVHECAGINPPTVIQIVLAQGTKAGTAPKAEEPKGHKIQSFQERVSKRIKRLPSRPDEHIQDEPE